MFLAAGAVARRIAPFLTVAAVAGMGFLAGPVQVRPAPEVRLADAVNPLAGMPSTSIPPRRLSAPRSVPIRRVPS